MEPAREVVKVVKILVGIRVAGHCRVALCLCSHRLSPSADLLRLQVGGKDLARALLQLGLLVQEQMPYDGEAELGRGHSAKVSLSGGLDCETCGRPPAFGSPAVTS